MSTDNHISPDEARRAIAYLKSTGDLREQLCILCSHRSIPGEELCADCIAAEAEQELEMIASALGNLKRLVEAAGDYLPAGLLTRIDLAGVSA